MTQPDSWFYVSNADTIDSPALLVYEGRLIRNIKTAIRMAGGTERLRPHVKTHKMEEVTLLQMKMGIHKFKCATIAEAEMLAKIGARDILLAYQPTGPKIDRYLNLLRQYPATDFSALVDDPDNLHQISRRASEKNLTLPLLIDVDPGMNRSGIAPEKGAFDLYTQISSLPGVRPVGLHAYDGHIRDSDFSVRKQRSDDAFQAVTRLQKDLKNAGYDVPVIVAGGSPTFPVHAMRENVELSPGTFVFWDFGYGDKFPDMDFKPAALVLTRIISKPGENLLCLDLGHKAVAAENPHPRVKFLELEVETFTVQSEEHLVVKIATGSQKYRVGDVLYGIPLHICPTVALHQEAVVIRGGMAVENWKVAARDRRISV